MKNNSRLFVALSFFAFLLATNTTLAASASALNAKVCTASYTSVSNIVISESGAQSDFGVVGTTTNNNLLFINAPAGFSFNPGTGSVSHSGAGNITSSTILFVSASTIAISYSVDNNTTLKSDVLTISGIQVKALSAASASATATIGSGSTAIVGISVGQTVATFQSAITSMVFSPSTPKYLDDASFSLNGSASHTLAGGVSLNSTSFSGTGVTGSNFNPATAGAGVQTLTYTVNTNSPTCSFTTTGVIDVNLRPANDVDNDGVTAAVETQLGTNPLVATDFATLGLDSDNDGLSNATETTLGSNPNLADSDSDGINDGLEVIQYVTNPLSNDTDGDGIFDNIDPEPGTDVCTMPLNGTYKGMLLSGGN